MKEKYDAFHRNNIWELIPYDPNINQKSDGTLDRDKACLVAKGSKKSWLLHQLNINNAFLSKCDSSLFILQDSIATLYILVYVDDIITTENNPIIVQQDISSLSKNFPLKDLGMQKFFGGIEVLHITNGLFLTQFKYVLDLLIETNMQDSKCVLSPIVFSQQLTLHDGTNLTDAT
ncbi:retrovirus-related pol polyprotein from transposon tnt 1-94 [Gossypium australe]|uniref:Retrovirus-related pol polyprotein from transposon tnt 1-94 n=1 Tax=Gossypium australe TaxID=47621 RepID=A0A5B6WE80_9ROSI|nr:retrovirus-related pol polyprotein from transposon tnt 1-94 [Gossypium australe]